MRGAQPARAFRAADRDGERRQADGGLSGIAPLRGQRSGRQSRALPADPGGGLARRPPRRQAICERALVRARERPDRQTAVLTHSAVLSFPRKREPIAPRTAASGVWVPAFAGTTRRVGRAT